MADRSSLLVSAVHAVHIGVVSSRKCSKAGQAEDLGLGSALVCASFRFVFVCAHAVESRSSARVRATSRVRIGVRFIPGNTFWYLTAANAPGP